MTNVSPWNKLSVEIRLNIRDLVINEGRLVVVQRNTEEKLDNWKGWKVPTRKTASILHVNHESRQYAMKSYKLLFPSSTEHYLYINSSDIVYLLTPPLPEVSYLDPVIDEMWELEGEMNLAAQYLCKDQHSINLAVDLVHMYLGHSYMTSDEPDENLRASYAQTWAENLSASSLRHLQKLVFIRNGDQILGGVSKTMSTAAWTLSPIPIGLETDLQNIYRQMCEQESSYFPLGVHTLPKLSLGTLD